MYDNLASYSFGAWPYNDRSEVDLKLKLTEASAKVLGEFFANFRSERMQVKVRKTDDGVTITLLAAVKTDGQ